MVTLKRLSDLAVVAVLALQPAMASADVVVSHFEPLQELAFDTSELHFAALGQDFNVRLQVNERVLAGLQPDDRAAGIGIYRGELTGRAGSWVRIVVHDGVPQGLIWDGVEMYAIEAPGDSDLAAAGTIIYRLADSYVVPGTMQCNGASLAGNTAEVLKNLTTASKTAIARAPGATSEITLSAIGDFEFTSSKGDDATAAAALAARLNNVDGFFSEQVGVQINVSHFETHSDQNDPFDDTLVPAQLLDQLSEYRLQTPVHNARGLTHLYTGRNFDGTTVGIAWEGTLCQNYFGAGLSEGRGSALNDSLIAAHEIGHNFGADHDGEAGSSCEAETGLYIMSPSINGSQQFSSCSIAIMQAEAAAASCVVALPAVDVSIKRQAPGSNILLGAKTDFVYEIASNGTVPVAAVSADVVLPGTLTLNSVMASTGTCTSGAGTVSCNLGDLAGLSKHSITIEATPIAVGAGVVDASVATTDTDERPSNNQDVLLLSVDPAVDLVIGAPSAAPVFVDADTVINVPLSNVSILDATNIQLEVTIETGLRINSATWSLGNCTVAAQQIDCQANGFAAQSVSTLSISATGVTAGRRDVAVSLSAAEVDANPGNNSVQVEVQVVTPKDDKDSGGGAGGIALLLLLTAMVLGRRLALPHADAEFT